MDISKEYIEMCQSSEEVQNKIKKTLENGDYYIMSGRTKIRIFDTEQWNNGKPDDIFEGEIPIWLPRQDQIQQAIKVLIVDNCIYPYSHTKLIQDFNSFVTEFESVNGFEAGDSIDQMWVNYFCYNFYGKIWNKMDKKWIKN